MRIVRLFKSEPNSEWDDLLPVDNEVLYEPEFNEIQKNK